MIHWASVVRATAFLGLACAASAQTISIDLQALHLPEAVEEPLRAAIDANDWPRAEALLFSVAETGSSNAALLQALGAAHLQNGRFLPAAIAYQRADRLEPLLPASRFALAKAYMGLQKPHWARRELERLAQEDPANALYPDALAGVFQDYQWFEMAEEQARRAVSLDPLSPGPYDRLGQALEGRHDTDRAFEAYRKALDLDRRQKRRSPWPAYHLGRLLLETGRTEEAAAALQEALQVDSEHVDALYEWAMTLRKLDRWDESLGVLEQAAALDPGQPRIHYALSQIYRRLGKLAEAQEAVRRFRALSPE